MNELPIHDIHLPDAVSGWPPAIGWWLLPIILLALAFAIYRLVKFNQQRTPRPLYKKIATNELRIIKNRFNDSDDSVELLRAISTLLRRIALSYLPRESVASLTGEQWVNKLNTLTPQALFTEELVQLLSHAPYQPQVDFNQQELLSLCEQWIKQLPEQAPEQPPEKLPEQSATQASEIQASKTEGQE